MREKRNWLVFLPNVNCNMETFSRVFLVLGNFLAVSHVFPRVFDTNMLVSKT